MSKAPFFLGAALITLGGALLSGCASQAERTPSTMSVQAGDVSHEVAGGAQPGTQARVSRPDLDDHASWYRWSSRE